MIHIKFYLIHDVRGEPGLMFQKGLIGLGVITAILMTTWLSDAPYLPTLLLLGVAMPTLGYGFMPRAQIFTYLFFSIWIYLLEGHRLRGGGWRLVIISCTAPLWANLHGGFLAGFGPLALSHPDADRGPHGGTPERRPGLDRPVPGRAFDTVCPQTLAGRSCRAQLTFHVARLSARERRAVARRARS
jgi:hypothetical protein